VPNTSADDLLRTARDLFAVDGYAATSIGHIAEAAGLSKSAVLYHYASKEALLEAVLTPAEAGLAAILARFPEASNGDVGYFVEPFIDFLLEHRQEASIFINQGQSLHGTPVIDRANSLVQQLGQAVTSGFENLSDRVRFGMALGGAAYILAAQENWGDPLDAPPQNDEIRAALVETVASLLTTTSTPVARR
jgi:AcrR family transcriptional regulator